MYYLIKTISKLAIIALLVAATACISETNCQESLITNAYHRSSTSLNGQWQYIIDPYENGYYNYRYEPFDKKSQPGNGAFFMNAKPNSPSDLVEYDFDLMDSLDVPGDWNSQKESLLYYEGTVWYKRSFDYQNKAAANRVFIYFEASNYKTEVYLNGRKLGVHIGGFTPFNFEVTDHLKDKDNFVVVKVDNTRTKDGVPTLNTDWWNYGGLTRGVRLIETANTFVDDYLIQLDPADSTYIKGHLSLNGEDHAQKSVVIAIPELGVYSEVVTNAKGIGTFKIKVDEVRYWSVEDPYLYQVAIKTEKEEINDQIGLRTISTEGTRILLNGKPIFLKGISIH